eukprot:CAMPEP_0204259836 /NCGR_PEP_ID=MMETSP0468-20130131/5922_1 /ASSEMBLY_ACC=CAM_ASM_000383 /TAXON_ID=2969 /ORGANISM="Oxyrrhis marina" /LENGTH=121 /DNA_ID=CAMNT_0051234185 /DNA_START=220 /DNA_END=585 /DNA_ORIENTATION=-
MSGQGNRTAEQEPRLDKGPAGNTTTRNHKPPDGKSGESGTRAARTFQQLEGPDRQRDQHQQRRPGALSKACGIAAVTTTQSTDFTHNRAYPAGGLLLPTKTSSLSLVCSQQPLYVSKQVLR